MLVVDILFVLVAKLLALGLQSGFSRLSAYAAGIPLDKATISSQSAEALSSILVQTKWVFFSTIALVISFVLLLLVAYSVANYAIWAIALRKQFFARAFARFFLLNLFWLCILGVFLSPWILLIASRPELLAGILQSLPVLSRVFGAVLAILVVLHPLLFLHAYFFARQRVWSTIGGLFTTGFGGLSQHIGKYVLGLVVSLVFAFVVSFAQQFVSRDVQFYVALLVGLVLLNWFKLWFAKDVKHAFQQVHSRPEVQRGS